MKRRKINRSWLVFSERSAQRAREEATSAHAASPDWRSSDDARTLRKEAGQIDRKEDHYRACSDGAATKRK
jgi:hypothetical protein